MIRQLNHKTTDLPSKIAVIAQAKTPVRLHINLLLLAIFLLLAWILTACAPATPVATSTPVESSGTATGPVRVSADEALTVLEDNPSAVLIDVRTAEEYAAGHIEGAQNLPVTEIKDRAAELPADKATPVIVYCRSGQRSAQAAADLVDLGYTAVYDLGGITSWPYELVQ